MKALLAGICIINEVRYGSHPFIWVQLRTMVKALLLLHCSLCRCDYPSEMSLFRLTALYPDRADVAVFRI